MKSSVRRYDKRKSKQEVLKALDEAFLRHRIDMSNRAHMKVVEDEIDTISYLCVDNLFDTATDARTNVYFRNLQVERIKRRSFFDLVKLYVVRKVIHRPGKLPKSRERVQEV